VTASIPPFPLRPPHPLLGGKPQRQRRPTSFHTAKNGKFPYFSFFAYRSWESLFPCVISRPMYNLWI
jgi:hypothetical protein